MKLAAEIPLKNGLTLCFRHRSHRYFGDYHHIEVDVICEIPITEEHFTSHAEFVEARAVLGQKTLFRRRMEMMGVPSAEVERSVSRVIENFTGHSLPYLSSPSFPRKLINSELATARRQKGSSYTG